jgi:uncharacterized protein YndB with AHSA1/START domain
MAQGQTAQTQTSQSNTTLPSLAEPVRKSVSVRANAAHAFQVFTQGMDSWWPRSHHIGSSPIKRVVVEGGKDGAIYTEQEDGTRCPWGTVLAWEPPHRFVMAWQVNPDWQYEPDPSKCSEVEVRFTPVDDGTTLVELEHRDFERHGGAFDQMRKQVNSDGGWGSLMDLFRGKAEEAK